MKILITGSAGMLGSDLSEILEGGHEIIKPTEKDLDITDRDTTIEMIRLTAPDITINCAAYTMVDQAERERDIAFTVNATGTQNLALGCQEINIPLCHISTDYVFNGTTQRPYTPFDNTDPINVYGESKLAGEMYVQWIMSKFYIVRTSWLYGKGRNNFVHTIQKLSREKEELKIVADQAGSPTWTITLAKGIDALIKTGAYGIYHITDDAEDGISWHEFAQEIVSATGHKTTVTPIATEEYPTMAKRPHYSVLDLSLNEGTFGFTSPSWNDSLHRYLSQG
jgi:dTDP-4-dehydrorhamnose reductase